MVALILFLSALSIAFIGGAWHSASSPTKPNQTLPDFTQFSDAKTKKTAFFNYLLPFIEQANSEVLTEREAILKIDFNQPTSKQQLQLQTLMEKYRVTDEQITLATQQKLLKKVDIIAPSLALAQAANESSWGTSRFAKEAYNFYGQWCFTEGCGLVPKQRRPGMTHEVKMFDTPYESVKGYMHNLNSHPYFKPLRDQRLQARNNNVQPAGLELVNGLTRYSERKEEYIADISAMIRNNNLAAFDY